MRIKHYLFLVIIFPSIAFNTFSINIAQTVQAAQTDVTQVKNPHLVFTNSEENILYKLDLHLSAQWIVRWNHSVTGVTVSDYYYWDGQNMLLTDSHTPAFDAGLGHIPGRGTLLSDGQNGYFIININEKVPNNSYALRVGSLKVNHRIIHNGNTYSLSEVAERQRVIISVTSD